MSCLTSFQNVRKYELPLNCSFGSLCTYAVGHATTIRRDASLHALSGKGRKPPKEEVSLRDIDPIQFQADCFCLQCESNRN